MTEEKIASQLLKLLADTHQGPSVAAKCDRCSRAFWHWGNEAKRLMRASRKQYGAKLCELCRSAHDRGHYQFNCEACGHESAGSFTEVEKLLNVYGKTFCRRCMEAFWGRYDPRNRALAAVIKYVPPKKRRPWRTVKEWEAEQERLRAEFKYYDNVRRVSRSNLRKQPQIVNPNRHPLGRSGTPGAFQLDHIVPVSVCWVHEVSIEDASSIENLQVIPWFVNTSRGNHFELERLVGWPHPPRPIHSRRRMRPMPP